MRNLRTTEFNRKGNPAEFADFAENIPVISRNMRNLRTTKFNGKSDPAEFAEFAENIPVISRNLRNMRSEKLQGKFVDCFICGICGICENRVLFCAVYFNFHS